MVFQYKIPLDESVEKKYSVSMKKFSKTMCFLLALVMGSAVMPIAGCAQPNDSENAPPDPDDALFENCVTYGEFGAVGDGTTDDFKAIKKAHEYANEHGVAVKANEGKRYYIPAIEDRIYVKTNVDWSGAEFVIDDKSAETNSKVWWHPVFNVVSETAPEAVEIPANYTLSAGQKNVNLTFDHNVLLAVYNENKRDFIRYGYNGNSWYPRQEILLVDKNGNVDSSTPVQWDYTEVTKITAYSVSDAPLLLRGGTFTTIANDDPVEVKNYFDRGIRIERSNVTVKNVKHYVSDEGDMGSPYNGFFRAVFSSNVVFRNCVMTGHKLYKNAGGGAQGTYDTRPLSCNNVRYLNCVQSNDHTDPAYWGIMCSDFCKNLYMDGCKLSRFDAHMGVYNATITNSDIGQNISVTGGGLLKIENVTKRCAPNTHYNRFVTLRADYGGFFYGDVMIKDSTLVTGRGINYVLATFWYDWDFGYECRFPKTVTLDNVGYRYENASDTYLHPCLYIYSNVIPSDQPFTTPEQAAVSKNPPVLTEKVIIKNNRNADGSEKTAYKIITKEGGDWFKDTVIENA